MATYSGSDKRLQFLFDMVSNFAQDYDNTTTYAVGAYAIFQGILYKCIIAVTAAEDFDDTKWTQVLVMNEIGSGGGGSVVSITPTLSSGTKIADFSINGISSELYAPSGGGGSGQDYSTTEHVIGTWIDGKPLYEKTVVFNNPPLGRVDNLAHNIANIDFIVKCEWGAYDSSGGDVIGFEANNANYWSSMFLVSKTGISYRIGAYWYVTKIVINMFYTKTTD